MFFVLSKIAALFLKPLNLILLAGATARFSKGLRVRKIAATLSAAMFLVFTNPLIINLLAGWWEIGQHQLSDISTPYDVGIVLGGYTETLAASTADIPTFSQSGNRLHTALVLYQNGKIRRLLLSGGSGRLLGREQNEALLVRDYLLKLGVPDSAIWVDDRSRNTKENALYSKALVDRLAPRASCLLITSAWHLRRAAPCFERAGLSCALFGTDFFEEKSEGNPLKWLLPSWKALMKWEYLIKEWVGWVAYRF